MTNFIKYKDEIINLDLVALITITNQEKNLFDFYTFWGTQHYQDSYKELVRICKCGKKLTKRL